MLYAKSRVRKAIALSSMFLLMTTLSGSCKKRTFNNDPNASKNNSVLDKAKYYLQPSFSFKDLKEIVETVVTDAKKRGAQPRVEDVLAKLPVEVRERSILVYESRSSGVRDAKFPRIILFSKFARLMMAVEGREDMKKGKFIEVIEFNDSKKTFEFSEIDFTGPQVVIRDQEAGQSIRRGEIVHEPRPQNCTTCHRKNSRPNWEGYPDWPGAFGGHAGRTNFGSPEHALFKEFIAARSQGDRYHHLPLIERNREVMDPNGNSHPFSAFKTIKEHEIVPDTAKGVPIVELSEYVGKRNLERIVRLIKNGDPQFEKFRHIYLGAAFRCKQFEAWTKPLEASGITLAQVRETHNKNVAAAQQRFVGVMVDTARPSQPHKPGDFFVFDARIAEVITNLTFFAKARKIDQAIALDEWSTSFYANTPAYGMPAEDVADVFVRYIVNDLFGLDKPLAVAQILTRTSGDEGGCAYLDKEIKKIQF
jgi:hypothetical protein